ncbi:cysteine-rich CWC family protein [Cohnella thermotolerans]|uniref:cysteine-rich CWC family protein n=1 Tax=Cohnella thermotolerans TaxID=329858 RepID=UPI00041ABDC9|nr:cysteine-rich CWC family protein [Cohnella thermotolerans]
MTNHPNPAPDETVDPTLCPLCGQPNGCALTEGRPIEACWCVQATVPEDVLKRIPPERRLKACVCPSCASGGQ